MIMVYVGETKIPGTVIYGRELAELLAFAYDYAHCRRKKLTFACDLVGLH